MRHDDAERAIVQRARRLVDRVGADPHQRRHAGGQRRNAELRDLAAPRTSRVRCRGTASRGRWRRQAPVRRRCAGDARRSPAPPRPPASCVWCCSAPVASFVSPSGYGSKRSTRAEQPVNRRQSTGRPVLHQRHQALQPIRLRRRLVGPDARDARKPQRHTGLVAIGQLRRVERHLQHQRLLHLAHRAEPRHGVVADPAIEERQLLVGEAEIRLADRHQLVAAPHAERVVGIVAAALAMAALRVHQHRIDGQRIALPLPPQPLHPARHIGRIAALQHQPLDRGRPRAVAQHHQLVQRGEPDQLRQIHPRRPRARIPGLQPLAPCIERQRAHILGRLEQHVVEPDADGIIRHHASR